MWGKLVSRRLLIVALLTFALRTALAQTGVSSPEGSPIQQCEAPGLYFAPSSPTTLTFAASGDGLNRYADLSLEKNRWLVTNINWTAPNLSDAFSLILAGRRLKIADRLDLSLLAGPWFEYANHAVDELVIDSNVHFQDKRIRFTAINHWGIPLKTTGYFFDAHLQLISGFPALPGWVGLRAQEEYEIGRLAELEVGPALTRKQGSISLIAAPYWDFARKTADLRLTVSYSLRR